MYTPNYTYFSTDIQNYRLNVPAGKVKLITGIINKPLSQFYEVMLIISNKTISLVSVTRNEFSIQKTIQHSLNNVNLNNGFFMKDTNRFYIHGDCDISTYKIKKIEGNIQSPQNQQSQQTKQTSVLVPMLKETRHFDKEIVKFVIWIDIMEDL